MKPVLFFLPLSFGQIWAQLLGRTAFGLILPKYVQVGSTVARVPSSPS